MSAPHTSPDPYRPAQPGLLTRSVNLFVAPTGTFEALRTNPSCLFPLAVVVLAGMAVMAWYFSVLDYSWYIDDTLSRVPELDESQLEEARDAMANLSQGTMMAISVIGSAVTLLGILLLQAAYLTLVSALGGDGYRFRQWFSLVSWTNLPYLLVTLSMAVNILLHPDGQLSIYALNGLSLHNLGVQSANASLNQVLSNVNLAQLWSLALLVMAYRQWLAVSTLRAMTVVLTPYLLIVGSWTYFSLS